MPLPTIDDVGAVDAIANLAAAAIGPSPLGGGGYLVTLPPGYKAECVNTQQYQPQPARAYGTFEFLDPSAWALYVRTHKTESTRVQLSPGEVLGACFNDHSASAGPGWRDYVAQVPLLIHSEWRAWMHADELKMTQVEWAEFLEEHIPSVAQPDAAMLFSATKNLRAHSSAEFASQITLSNGQVRLTYSEEMEAGGGAHGDIRLPEELVLALSCYQDFLAPQPVRALFRWRIEKGRATFWFKLNRDDVRLAQLAGIAQVGAFVQDETGLPMYR